MFPTGTAGAALFLLRISVAATLVVDGIAHWAPVTSFWILLAIAIPAIFLSFGFLTPYLSAVSGLIHLGILITMSGDGQFHAATSALYCVILAVLGPGAYSIDARVFGRRLLTISPRK